MPAAPIDPIHIGTPDFERLVDDMIDAMRTAPGVGVAAPQVGVSSQVFVLEDQNVGDGDEDTRVREHHPIPLHVVVNPTLEPMGDETVPSYEGCLSIAGFAADVERWNAVRVKGLDRKGKPIELEWRGWPARILQHEFDHLQGTLYIDRMNSRTFSTVENLHDQY